MAGFRVFTSNRMERLVEGLAGELKEPLLSPLDPEVVVVQSQGMEKWLSMELAGRMGICANFRFPFPRALVDSLLDAVIPEASVDDPYNPETMTWRIMRLIPGLLDDPAFSSLRKYLHGECSSLRFYQLSRRISAAFDQYLVFRAEMVLSWYQGKEDHWQAVLWRKLGKDAGGRPHRASLAVRFIDAMSEDRPVNFPHRISLFGISTMPPLYLNILYAASAKTTINLFLMSPCREYWGDIVSHRKAAQIVGRASLKEGEGDPDLHIGGENSILASTGEAGREFIDALMELPLAEETELFEEPEGASMLSRLQSDILNLKERGEGSCAKITVPAADLSIRINSCHSPVREMEVLQDILLDMFEKDRGINPGDVLVMTPDIETYAPFINAVFDSPEGDPRKIPYRVADRSSAHDRLAVDTFMAILNLPVGRFSASRVMEIMRSPLVARRFQVDEKGLGILEALIRGSGIRWGLDEASKAAMGLPPGKANTWRSGLERLLLGYAMPGFGEAIFKAVAPYDNIEGKDSQILGSLIDLIEKLGFLEKELGLPHRAGEWSAILGAVLDAFFPDGDGGSLRKLKDVVSGFILVEEHAGFDGLLELPVIKEHLKNTLQGEALGRGFMDGGITFCAMVPMRSVPRRVICLVGLNGDSFPGRSSSADFDLIASSPKRCDRSRRKDDRYLFLESLLSARDTFCISYVGQDIKDNSTIPPSVLVSDLMDYIERAFVPEEGKKILEKVVIRHRLQAFSPAYFEGGPLFSYSRADLEAAKALCRQSGGETPFISRPLNGQEERYASIGIESLSSFFVNPCKFLLKRRLGVNLEGADAAIDDEEPFELAGLERYKMAQELLKKEMERQDLDSIFPVKKATGELPHGTMGRLEYFSLAGRSRDLAGTIEDFISPGDESVATISLELSGLTISGTVRGIYGSRIIRCRNAAVGGRDRIRLWVELLLLSCCQPERGPIAGVLAGWGKGPELMEIRAPEAALDIFSELVELYKEGLKAPLRFFPETSWQYASDVASKGASPEKALKGAVAAWESQYGKSREKDDPYIRLCFGKDIPLDAEFQRLSLKIFAPLISGRSA